MKKIIVFILVVGFALPVKSQIDFKSNSLLYTQKKIERNNRLTKKLLYQHYRTKKGKDFIFSSELANDIFSVIDRRNLVAKKGRHKFIHKEGNIYWYSINTYYTKYSLTLGRVNVGFSMNPQNHTIELVAIEDVFDFNKKKMGGRPFIFEAVTRFFGSVTRIKKGTPFKLIYLESEIER